MAYSSPIQRMAFYRGVRLGTELVSIIPGSQRLGSESSGDIDKDTAYVSIMSPNMEFKYTVIVYLDGGIVAGKTRQLSLHHAFLQEMLTLQSVGLKFNDLVWIDDISRHTTVNGGGTVTGESLGLSVALTSKPALGTINVGSYVWIGSIASKNGFFARVNGGDATHITIDVPGAVIVGGVTEEEARVVAAGYDVYFVDTGFHRCRYSGQGLPEVQEGTLDTERYSMSYEFISDRLPNFEGEA